jgi:type II secretory pathway component PulC
MKPDYQGSAIAGYRLDIEGEERFFKDVGMKPGDVVRKVNSMAMVSQSRAEFFIREFVKGNLGAVVLDIERQGQPEKLVYLIR